MVGDGDIANRPFSGAHAFEEIARVARAVIEARFVGPQGLAENVGRVGNDDFAPHGDPARGADDAHPAIAPHGLTRIVFAMDHDPVGVLQTQAVTFQEDFDRPRVIGARGPLDDIVVVLAPIQFTDVEAMGAGIAIVGEPGRRAEVKVPVEAVGHRMPGAKLVGQKIPPPSR